MPNLTSKGLKKPLTTEAYDVEVVNFNSDKINELFVAQDTTNENVSQQMEQKADKDRLQFKSDNYKTALDLPSTYDNGITEFYTSTADWKTLTGLTNNIVVRTERRSNFFIKQEFFSVTGQLLKYRLGKDTALDEWGKIETIATTDKIDISSGFLNGYGGNLEVTVSGKLAYIRGTITTPASVSGWQDILNLPNISPTINAHQFILGTVDDDTSNLFSNNSSLKFTVINSLIKSTMGVLANTKYQIFGSFRIL